MKGRDQQAVDRANGRPVVLAAILCACLLGALPCFGLFYAGLGTALLGALLLGALILVQYFLFFPLWNRLRRPREPADAAAADTPRLDGTGR